MDGALERVEGVFGAVFDHSEKLGVVVSANFADGHGKVPRLSMSRDLVSTKGALSRPPRRIFDERRGLGAHGELAGRPGGAAAVAVQAELREQLVAALLAGMRPFDSVSQAPRGSYLGGAFF